LNFYFDSFPDEKDLDPALKSFNSLFRSAVLFSHYRIVFNLTSVYISLFLYPGRFWDSFNEFKYRRKKGFKPYNLVSFDFFRKSVYRKNHFFSRGQKLLSSKTAFGKLNSFYNFFKRFFGPKKVLALVSIFKRRDLRRYFDLRSNSLKNYTTKIGFSLRSIFLLLRRLADSSYIYKYFGYIKKLQIKFRAQGKLFVVPYAVSRFFKKKRFKFFFKRFSNRLGLNL